jgi:peroxiredoxin
MLTKGSIAPDFALEDQTRQVIRLSDYRGKKHVVVAFHPFAFTPVCTRQMQSYEQAKSTLEGLDAAVLGISTDTGPAKAAWAAAMSAGQGLSIHLLSDHYPHGQVAAAYGVLGPHGFADRAVFIVDKTGTIAWSKLHGMDDDPSLPELLEVLSGLARHANHT